MQKVVAWLRERAAEDRRRIARNDGGRVLDPRTGEFDPRDPEGQLRLTRWQVRSRLLREALYCVRLLCPDRPEGVEDLLVFLEDPHDALVVETLQALGQWRVEEALPAILALYRLYPAPDRWAGSAGRAGSEEAKDTEATWRVTFAHPGKRRERPEVVRAIRSCLEQIAGKAFAGPAALARHLEEAGDGRRRSAA